MSRSAVLFIHGFMGLPAQFDFLLPAAREAGWDIRCPTLPGHAADISDFVKHGARDWAAAVAAELERLRGEYDRIVIVGHSMGGLLALDAALKVPDKIARIIAVALPLRIGLTADALRIRLASLQAARADEDVRVTAARELCGVAGITLANSAALLPNSIALLALAREARKGLRRLCVPLTVINSAGDELVARSALRCLAQLAPQSESIELERSSHFWYCEEERKVIASALKTALH